MDAYAVFRKYPQPRSLHASSVRDPVEILNTLTSAPMPKLEAEALGPYAGWALTTVGGADDYRHFLPRILHLSAIGEPWMGLDPEIIADKLQYAGYRQWSAEEQMAVDTVFEARWARARLQHPDEEDASEWLCGLAILELDLERNLNGWLEDMIPDAVVQFAQLMTDAEAIAKGTASWANVTFENRQRIADWCCSAPVMAAIVEAVDQVKPADQWLIDMIDENISILKSGQWS